MEKKEIKLSEFLKENNAYKVFVRNFDREYFIDTRSDEVRIINAFDWEDSEQRYKFWDKLDDKWKEVNSDLKVYDMNWLLNEKQGESLVSNISVIYNNDGYEALYLDNELIEEGNPLNEGQERVLYFINTCDKYNFNIKDIKFGYCDCEEFPISLLELDDIEWEN